MHRTEIRKLRTILAGIPLGSKSYRFLMTPDGGDGPALIVRRGRIPPTDKLELIQAGAKRFAEGTVSRTKDGLVMFAGNGVNDKKVRAITGPLVRDLPVLANAVSGKR